MTAAQMRASVQQMKNMDPDTMKNMAQMAGAMGGTGGMKGGTSPEAAADMMKNMKPEQLKAMAEQMVTMIPARWCELFDLDLCLHRKIWTQR